MMEVLTRISRGSDTAALRRIWTTAFGDGDDEDFFSFYFRPEMCVVVESGGTASAAGYLIPFGNFIYGDVKVRCAMIYAVAVLPDVRNRGYGTLIVRDLIARGHAAGYPAVVLCPASDGLFGYYSTRSVLRDYFYVAERRIVETLSAALPARLSRVSPDEYGSLRERFLSGVPHIEIDRDGLLYQDLLCSHAGGGLYLAETIDGDACAVVEPQHDGSVWVKELLCPGGVDASALSSIASVFPADSYIVRTPAQADAPLDVAPLDVAQPVVAPRFPARRFGMIAADPGVTASAARTKTAPWFGLSFD